MRQHKLTLSFATRISKGAPSTVRPLPFMACTVRGTAPTPCAKSPSYCRHFGPAEGAVAAHTGTEARAPPGPTQPPCRASRLDDPPRGPRRFSKVFIPRHSTSSISVFCPTWTQPEGNTTARAGRGSGRADDRRFRRCVWPAAYQTLSPEWLGFQRRLRPEPPEADEPVSAQQFLDRRGRPTGGSMAWPIMSPRSPISTERPRRSPRSSFRIQTATPISRRKLGLQRRPERRWRPGRCCPSPSSASPRVAMSPTGWKATARVSISFPASSRARALRPPRVGGRSRTLSVRRTGDDARVTGLEPIRWIGQTDLQRPEGALAPIPHPGGRAGAGPTGARPSGLAAAPDAAALADRRADDRRARGSGAGQEVLDLPASTWPTTCRP